MTKKNYFKYETVKEWNSLMIRRILYKCLISSQCFARNLPNSEDDGRNAYLSNPAIKCRDNFHVILVDDELNFGMILQKTDSVAYTCFSPVAFESSEKSVEMRDHSDRVARNMDRRSK